MQNREKLQLVEDLTRRVLESKSILEADFWDARTEISPQCLQSDGTLVGETLMRGLKLSEIWVLLLKLQDIVLQDVRRDLILMELVQIGL